MYTPLGTHSTLPKIPAQCRASQTRKRTNANPVHQDPCDSTSCFVGSFTRGKVTPAEKEGQLPESCHIEIRDNLRYICARLEEGQPEQALRCLKIWGQQDDAHIKQLIIARTLASQHLNILVRAIRRAKSCGVEGCVCQENRASDLFTTILCHCSYGLHLPYDHVGLQTWPNTVLPLIATVKLSFSLDIASRYFSTD